MKQYYTPGVIVFTIFNYIFISVMALTCILPFINMIAISFSSSNAAAAGRVGLWPVEFSPNSYNLVMENIKFWKAALVSIRRIVIAVPLNLAFTVITAYPLSKEPSEFKMRNIYVWFFMITMLFSGGLIPFYLVIKTLGIMDTIWALTIPGAFSIWNTIIMLNFFRGLPKELEEAALIDGAGYLTTLARIILPLSTPSLATIALFSIVAHWNSWFDGLIYMNRSDNYPLQSYLQTVNIDPATLFRNIKDPAIVAKYLSTSKKTLRAAQLFIAALPVLAAYPFLQKYFTKGLVLGSVKG